MDSSHCSRWTTIVAVLVLAMIAAVVSYSHMYDLALRHGEPAWRAALFPLSVDGTVVAASMTLLSDARQGRRGGFLPWTLLIIGSVASLAANIVVVDPAVWSRVIHAWPSLALLGAYELLMRHFRADAVGDHLANAGRSPTQATHEERRLSTAPASQQRRATNPYVRLVGDHADSNTPEVVDLAQGPRLPQVQCQAWAWALDHRRGDGSLPSGREISQAFRRTERWGRLVKQRGEHGILTA